MQRFTQRQKNWFPVKFSLYHVLMAVNVETSPKTASVSKTRKMWFTGSESVASMD